MSVGGCLSPDGLRTLVEAPEEGLRESEFLEHARTCSSCWNQLKVLSESDQWLQSFRSVPSPESLSQSDLRSISSFNERMLRRFSKPSDEQACWAMEEILSQLEKSANHESLGSLDGFEILKLIGAGGMGVVLKAKDPVLDRAVAIKILHPGMAMLESARQRFVREARAIAAIDLANIVSIFHVQAEGRFPYFVMEFVEGFSLEERLREGAPLPVEEIVSVGRDIAAGLEAVHNMGLVHRDIKPGNILIDAATGRAKLTDFGLVQVSEQGRLTRPGDLPGTPAFLSPEQARGESVDARADLFALGAVFYTMATGQCPFQSSTTIATIRRVCDYDPPPLRELNRELPLSFCELVDRLLRKDRERRVSSAKEVQEWLEGDLEAAHTSSLSMKFVAFFKERGQGVIAAVMLIALLALFMAGSDYFRETEADDRLAGSYGSNLNESDLSEVTHVTPQFYIPGNRDGSGSSFESFEEALKAVPAGGTIECRWTGDWRTEPIDLGDKPLILRATRGHRPVFVGTRRPEPLLRSRALLVLEGLTLKLPTIQPDVVGATYHSPFGDVVLEMIHAPLFMANCRVEMHRLVGGPIGPNILIGVKGPGKAVFENCELYAASVGSVAYLPESRDQERSDRLVFRNCVQTGFSMVQIKETCREGPWLELVGNTAAVGYVAGVTDDHPSGHPVIIQARHNIFDLSRVLNTGPAASRHPVESLFRWEDETNLVQVKKEFTWSNPPLATAQEWKRFAGVKPDRPLTVELSLYHRIQQWRRRMDELGSDKFVLTRTEREACRSVWPSLASGLGVNPQTCGPGRAYESWRLTPDHLAWLEEVGSLMVSAMENRPALEAALKE